MTIRGRHAESGGIVTGWLFKVVLVFAIVGVIAYDAIGISFARVTASDDAHSIAEAASDAIIVSRAPPERALFVAQQRAESRGIVLGPKDVIIAANGAVTVHIHRTASTVIAHHIGPLQKYTQIDETYTTSPAPQ